MWSFLNPLFLSALAAALIPLVLHLWQRQRIVVVPFSTVRFLKLAQKRSSNRVRLENVLLWFLRTLILLLLALTVLLFIIFRSYHAFSGSRKVFRSIGAAFSVFRRTPGQAWFALTAAFLTISALQAVQLPFRTFFFLRPQRHFGS